MFAYGQTGSGKTFTMAGNEAAPGIIPQSMHQVFENVRNSPQSKTFALKASMMEIYDEKMYDLLNKRKSVLLRSTVVKGSKKLTFQGLEASLSCLEQLIGRGRSTQSKRRARRWRCWIKGWPPRQ